MVPRHQEKEPDHSTSHTKAFLFIKLGVESEGQNYFLIFFSFKILCFYGVRFVSRIQLNSFLLHFFKEI